MAQNLPDSPGSAQAHLERAFEYEGKDELENALQECDRAIQLDPNLAEAHNLRGALLALSAICGEVVDKGRRSSEEALRKQP